MVLKQGIPGIARAGEWLIYDPGNPTHPLSVTRFLGPEDLETVMPHLPRPSHPEPVDPLLGPRRRLRLVK